MAVDDPGRRREQRGDAVQLGFEPACLRRAQPFEIGDAVGPRRSLDLLDPGDLLLGGGDDQLAERGMRYAVLAAIFIEPPAALDTAPRLQAARRVVEPAVDHLAVARGGLETDRMG